MKTKQIVLGGLIAALYTALTYISAAFGLAHGAVQFRLGEALMALALFEPSAIWGLTAGCALSNLASSLGPIDVLIGALATALAAMLMFTLRKKLPAALLLLLPAVINALAIGAEIALASGGKGFIFSALSVAIGEIAVLILGGYPLVALLKKRDIFKSLK